MGAYHSPSAEHPERVIRSPTVGSPQNDPNGESWSEPLSPLSAALIA